jgi:GntR family histidine utilization transcriptional repressor
MDTKNQPQYKRIKAYITDKVMSGVWPVGQRTPTEEDLVALFGVSRMTVHRAVRELVVEGLVRRRQGAGTFVTNERPRLDLIEVRNIADDIRSRGHEHISVVHLLQQEKASETVAEALGLRKGAKVFHSVIVHLEDRWPIQLEDR